MGGQDFGTALALQADGKLLLAGYSSGNFALARYTLTNTLPSTVTPIPTPTSTLLPTAAPTATPTTVPSQTSTTALPDQATTLTAPQHQLLLPFISRRR